MSSHFFFFLFSFFFDSYDAKEPNKGASTEGHRWGSLTGSGLKAAFTKAGLGPR